MSRSKEKPPRLPPMKKVDVKFKKIKEKHSKQIMDSIPDTLFEQESRSDQASQLKLILEDYYESKSLVNDIMMDFFGYENYASLYFLLKQDPVAKPNGRPSLLSEQEIENFIALVTNRFDSNNPLSYHDAFLFLKQQNDKIDQQYIYSFISRHSERLDSYDSRVIDRKRHGVDYNSVINYINFLNNLLSEHDGISSNLFFNIDEIGFGDMQTMSSIKTIGPKGRVEIPDYPIPPSVSRITAIITIFLDGSVATPMIIIPTQTIDKRVLEHLGQFRNFVVVHQKNGFVNEELFAMYLQRILFPEIERRRVTYNLQGKKVVGVIDGCSSHCTFGVKELLTLNNVNCVYLPPHSSHILQPLDTCMFSMIKRDYKKNFECSSLRDDESTENVSRLGNSFISIVKSIQNNVDPTTVKNSFKMVGITEGIHINGQTFVVNNPNTRHVENNLKNENSLPISSSFLDNRFRINLN